MSLYLYEKFLEYIGCQWVGTGDDEEAAKAVLDAYIARAEAAVRFADAAARCPGWEAVDEGHGKELMELVGAYEAARESVRNLEEKDGVK